MQFRTIFSASLAVLALSGSLAHAGTGASPGDPCVSSIPGIDPASILRNITCAAKPVGVATINVPSVPWIRIPGSEIPRPIQPKVEDAAYVRLTPAERAGDPSILALQGLPGSGIKANSTANARLRLMPSRPPAQVYARYSPGTGLLRIDIVKNEKYRNAVGAFVEGTTYTTFTPYHGLRWSVAGTYGELGEVAPNPFARFASPGTPDEYFHNCNQACMAVAVDHAVRLFRAPGAIILASDLTQFETVASQAGSTYTQQVVYNQQAAIQPVYFAMIPPEREPTGITYAICAGDEPLCSQRHIVPAALNLIHWAWQPWTKALPMAVDVNSTPVPEPVALAGGSWTTTLADTDTGTRTKNVVRMSALVLTALRASLVSTTLPPQVLDALKAIGGAGVADLPLDKPLAAVAATPASEATGKGYSQGRTLAGSGGMQEAIEAINKGAAAYGIAYAGTGRLMVDTSGEAALRDAAEAYVKMAPASLGVMDAFSKLLMGGCAAQSQLSACANLSNTGTMPRPGQYREAEAAWLQQHSTAVWYDPRTAKTEGRGYDPSIGLRDSP